MCQLQFITICLIGLIPVGCPPLLIVKSKYTFTQSQNDHHQKGIFLHNIADLLNNRVKFVNEFLHYQFLLNLSLCSIINRFYLREINCMEKMNVLHNFYSLQHYWQPFDSPRWNYLSPINISLEMPWFEWSGIILSSIFLTCLPINATRI